MGEGEGGWCPSRHAGRGQLVSWAHTSCTRGSGLTLSATPPKITLKLPTEDDDKGSKEPARKRAKLNTDGIPDEYAVVMPSERVKNTYIFSEAERVWVAKPGSGGASQRRKHQKGEYTAGTVCAATVIHR